MERVLYIKTLWVTVANHCNKRVSAGFFVASRNTSVCICATCSTFPWITLHLSFVCQTDHRFINTGERKTCTLKRDWIDLLTSHNTRQMRRLTSLSLWWKNTHFLNVHLIIANHLAAIKHQRNKPDLDHISAAEVSLFYNDFFEVFNVCSLFCLCPLGWATRRSAWKVLSSRRRTRWPRRLRNWSSSTASENLWVKKRFSSKRCLTSSFRLSTL